MFPAFLAGSIAAAVGAAAWWAVAAFFNYEHSIVAWIIGGLVGFAVARANGGHGSKQAGILAAGLAVMSIVVGKYMAFQTFIPEVGDMVTEFDTMLDENAELLVSYVADDVAAEMEGAGQTLDWPPVPDGEVPDEMSEYPPAVWTAATARWDAMSESDQEAYKSNILTNYEADMAGFFAELDASFLSVSFGMFDILFLGLAVVTAFQLASHGMDEEELEPVPAEDPPAPPPDAV